MNESFVVVNDLFMIVFDFVIAIWRNFWKWKEALCVRRQAERLYVCRREAFFFRKITFVPGLYVLGQKVLAHLSRLLNPGCKTGIKGSC